MDFSWKGWKETGIEGFRIFQVYSILVSRPMLGPPELGPGDEDGFIRAMVFV
jgi:hypothetical protein